MVSLILAMIRARLAAAVTLVLLAAFAVAGAVAGPAYLAAVDQAIVRQEVAAAPVAERTVTSSITLGLPDGPDQSGLDFGTIAPTLVGLPGFTLVYSAEVKVLGLDPGPRPGAVRLVHRQDVCAHLVLVAGRCVTGVSEIVVGEATARRLKLSAGDVVPLTNAQPNPDQTHPGWLPNGEPSSFTVAGVYRARDRTELYWGPHAYFTPTDLGQSTGAGTGQGDEPAFVTQSALAALDHQTEQVSIDALAGPDTFAPGHLASLRDQVTQLRARGSELGDAVALATSIPNLLQRIERSRAPAHQVVPVAAVPLVLLAWFVIFLAVGYGTEGRRPELGLIALRGTRWPQRWWLAAGEAVLPIALGAVLGYPVGPWLIQLLAPVASRTAVPVLSVDALGYALLAAAGALLVALAAQRRELFAQVVALLRQVPARSGRWRSAAVEAVVVVLAVVAAVQLRLSSGQLTGLGLLAPALVIAGVAVLSAAALLPLASWYGAGALRRGRLGPALAAVELGRRPGIQRLFVLLVAAVALLGFAASATEAAGQARADRAQIGNGAVRVLTLDTVTRSNLLQAVRAVDPQGRFAMAVARVPDGPPGEAPKLGVDSTRLATVATWRPDFGALTAAQVAARLRPAGPAPVVLKGDEFALDVTADPVDPGDLVRIGLTLVPPSGGQPDSIDLGSLLAGDHTYRQRVDGCVAGCRVVGLRIWSAVASGFSTTVTFRALRAIGPDGTVATVGSFTPDGWRAASPTELTRVPAGLRAKVSQTSGASDTGLIQPIDTPYPLPVVSTAKLPSGTELVGLDHHPVPVTQVGTALGLPRLGNWGTLLDLEYADRVASDAGTAGQPEIWLGPDAPADILSRVAGQGLVVTGDQTVAAVRADLNRQGPALALRFHLLTAAFAVALAAGGIWLVVTVDRRRRAADLAALRIQGVPRRVLGRAAMWGYLVVVFVALVVGLGAAAVAWWVAGWGIPVFVDNPGNWPLPSWPRPGPVLAAWSGAGVFLLLVAWIAATRLRRTIGRTS